MDEKKKKKSLRDSNWPYLLVIAFLLIVVIAQPLYSAATLKTNFTSGINTWDWDGQVIQGTLTGGADTYNVPEGLDPDMCLFSYNDQASITLPISWSYSDGSVISGIAGVLSMAGDSGEAYTGLILDFRGY
jgi:hypothetical protein